MGSFSMRTSRLFPTSSRQAGQKCQCTKEPWRFAHCTAVTTCLATFPVRKLPTRQGPQRAAFHCLGAAKSSLWHPAISVKESSPLFLYSKPQQNSDIPPWSSTVPCPHTHPEPAERRCIPPCVPHGYHVGFFSGVTLTLWISYKWWVEKHKRCGNTNPKD